MGFQRCCPFNFFLINLYKRIYNNGILNLWLFLDWAAIKEIRMAHRKSMDTDRNPSSEDHAQKTIAPLVCYFSLYIEIAIYSSRIINFLVIFHTFSFICFSFECLQACIFMSLKFLGCHSGLRCYNWILEENFIHGCSNTWGLFAIQENKSRESKTTAM